MKNKGYFNLKNAEKLYTKIVMDFMEEY